jgi:hypothetical protein
MTEFGTFTDNRQDILSIYLADSEVIYTGSYPYLGMNSDTTMYKCKDRILVLGKLGYYFVKWV